MTPYRQDVTGLGRVVLDLLPELADVNIDDPVDDRLAVPVALIQKLLPGKSLSGELISACRILNSDDVSITGGRCALPCVSPDPVQSAKREECGGSRDAGLLRREDRLHPLHQFAGAERFDHVIIGAHRQSRDPVHLLFPCRKHQDRDIGTFRSVRQISQPSTFGSMTSRITKTEFANAGGLDRLPAIVDNDRREALPLEICRNQRSVLRSSSTIRTVP